MCLEACESRPKVGGVCGYALPINFRSLRSLSGHSTHIIFQYIHLCHEYEYMCTVVFM